MKCGRKPLGFTVVETMIFLAVSGALLLSAMAFITSTQSSTQFKQGANDALQQINGVIGNVSDGYYPNRAQFTCNVAGGTLNITSSSPTNREQGTNADCVYLGRVIEFQPGPSPYEKFIIHDVAGKRQIPNAGGILRDVSSMSEASPVLIDETKQEVKYRNGIRFGYLKRGGVVVNAAGFFSSMAEVAVSGVGAGDTASSAQQYDFVGYSFGAGLVTNYDANKNNPDGLELCLTDGDRQAIITIGGSNKSATSSMTIGLGGCAS